MPYTCYPSSPPLYSVTGFRVIFYFPDAAAFAAASVLPVGFRHLYDDGLGCLILLSAVFTANIFGYFSIFGIRFSRYAAE